MIIIIYYLEICLIGSVISFLCESFCCLRNSLELNVCFFIINIYEFIVLCCVFNFLIVVLKPSTSKLKFNETEENTQWYNKQHYLSRVIFLSFQISNEKMNLVFNSDLHLLNLRPFTTHRVITSGIDWPYAVL